MRGFKIRLAPLLTSNIVAMSSSNHKHSSREKLQEQGLVSLAKCQHFSFNKVKFSTHSILDQLGWSSNGNNSLENKSGNNGKLHIDGWWLMEREGNQTLKC